MIVAERIKITTKNHQTTRFYLYDAKAQKDIGIFKNKSDITKENMNRQVKSWDWGGGLLYIQVY
ncbi:MAG: hypothetical protein NC489_32160 [Ruminococcus flavefaciens]|nr:hypothetical protein [Ruminococcus flavefaciens]